MSQFGHIEYKVNIVWGALLGLIYFILLFAAQPGQAGLWIVVDLILAGALISISVVDIASFRIPNVLSLPLMVMGIGVTWVQAPDQLMVHLVAAALIFLGFIALDRMFMVLRGRHGLGMGDAKLIAAGVLWVGPLAIPSILMLASIGGIAFVLLRGKGRFGKIPFGPFLALAIWWVWLFDNAVFLTIIR